MGRAAKREGAPGKDGGRSPRQGRRKETPARTTERAPGKDDGKRPRQGRRKETPARTTERDPGKDAFTPRPEA